MKQSVETHLVSCGNRALNAATVDSSEAKRNPMQHTQSTSSGNISPLGRRDVLTCTRIPYTVEDSRRPIGLGPKSCGAPLRERGHNPASSSLYCVQYNVQQNPIYKIGAIAYLLKPMTMLIRLLCSSMSVSHQ